MPEYQGQKIYKYSHGVPVEHFYNASPWNEIITFIIVAGFFILGLFFIFQIVSGTLMMHPDHPLYEKAQRESVSPMEFLDNERGNYQQKQPQQSFYDLPGVQRNPDLKPRKSKTRR